MWYLPPVMMEEAKFCPRCSARLEMKEVNGAQRPRCPECGRVIYYDPKLAATVVVERDDRVLMVRRAIQPGIGLWSLPGGYVDRGEVVEVAAAREVLEETGLEVDVTGLVGVFSQEGQPVILVTYDSRISGGRTAAGPEIQEVGFFPPEELPPLAFSRDREILRAWKMLREERRHSTVGG